MTPVNTNEERVLQRARHLFTLDYVGDSEIRATGKLGKSILVNRPEGGFHSWIVPVTLEGCMAGYLQLNGELELIRYTSFQRRPGSTDGCPEASSWLDPARIRRKATELLEPGETLGEPVLTYDQYPDRIAWRLDVYSEQGTVRFIFVAGDLAYERANLDDSIGGG